MAQQRMGPSGFQLAGDNSFDDGALDFDGVKNVSIGVREKQIVYISLTYSRGENKETITHGEQPNENMEVLSLHTLFHLFYIRMQSIDIANYFKCI